jgi:hypothetical protein
MNTQCIHGLGRFFFRGSFAVIDARTAPHIAAATDSRYFQWPCVISVVVLLRSGVTIRTLNHLSFQANKVAFLDCGGNVLTSQALIAGPVPLVSLLGADLGAGKAKTSRGTAELHGKSALLAWLFDVIDDHLGSLRLCGRWSKDVGAQGYCLPLTPLWNCVFVTPCPNGLFGRIEKRGNLNVCRQAETIFDLSLCDVHDAVNHCLLFEVNHYLRTSVNAC